MNQIICAALENRWHEIFRGLKLVTPDNANGSSFVVGAVENNLVEIVTNGGAHIEINRQTFLTALDFL